jgi:hypothetical protein
LILLAFLATSSAEQLSLPFFENQVRVGLREGCAGTSDADAIQSAEARIAETIGLIFEVQAEIRDREAQLLRLLRER